MQDFFFASVHLTCLTHFHYCPTQTCDFPASSPSLSTTPESLREGRSRREHTSLLFFPFYPFMSPRTSISKGYWVLEILGGKTEGQHLALSCVKVSPSLFSTHWSYVEILSAIKRVKWPAPIIRPHKWPWTPAVVGMIGSQASLERNPSCWMKDSNKWSHPWAQSSTEAAFDNIRLDDLEKASRSLPTFAHVSHVASRLGYLRRAPLN